MHFFIFWIFEYSTTCFDQKKLGFKERFYFGIILQTNSIYLNKNWILYFPDKLLSVVSKDCSTVWNAEVMQTADISVKQAKQHYFTQILV